MPETILCFTFKTPQNSDSTYESMIILVFFAFRDDADGEKKRKIFYLLEGSGRGGRCSRFTIYATESCYDQALNKSADVKWLGVK